MSQLLVTLIAMHAGCYDKAGNERLVEQRAHCDAGSETPFEVPSDSKLSTTGTPLTPRRDERRAHPKHD